MTEVQKFLTDLASLCEADSITVEWRGYFRLDGRFHVRIGRLDRTQPHGWATFYGHGPTVEAAMGAAMAEFRAVPAGETSEAEEIDQ